MITSLTNQTVKDIRALSMRKVREEAGLFIAEGLKLVADAIEGGWPIRILVHRAGEDTPMLARALEATRRAGGEVVEVTPEILEKLSRRENPQTVHRRVRAAARADRATFASKPTPCGSASTGCATRAISAPSSAPPTRSAPRA